jgi:RNA polymerase sigma-70 factor (ECF subfamily)
MELERIVRERLSAGDANGAATAAIEALGPGVLRYLRSMLRDEADAGDTFGEWSENLWAGLPSWRGEASLKTWAYRLAWNAAQNLRDQAWRRRGQPLTSGRAAALAESIRTRSAEVRERQRSKLDELRALLTDEERSLLALRVDQELEWNEVAEIMAAAGEPIPRNTLMKRFERVKARLAKLAREHGLID